MGSSKRGAFLLGAILVISAILGGLYGPSLRATAAGAGTLQDSVKSFARVLAIVQQNYAEPVPTNKVVFNGAIPGMLHVLDPHSNFFDPKQYRLLEEEQLGKYYGVGMTIAAQNGHTVVLAPFVGSPAYKAGIRPGDIILKVDGKPCDGLTTLQVATMLKGPKGTVVTVALGREGWAKPIVVNLVRAEIPRPGVEYSTLVRPGVGYVNISEFNDTTDSDLAAALRKLDYPRLDGLIIDLRGDPGGLLMQAVGVADMFLDKNQLVVSHHGRASPERRYYAVRGNGGVDVPLVVLINGGTASASEIVSGALQDHDRGLIVGTRSFGKGLVQTQFPLSDHSALLLTTARYYTPSGRLIQRSYNDITLYDYQFNRQPPKQPQVRLTDSGRKVYGGGGITPDVVFPEPKLDPFQQLLLERNVLFPFQFGAGDFTRHFLAKRPSISKDFTVDGAVMKQFLHFLDTEHIRYTPQQIQDNLSWLQWRIKREVLISAFGLNAGYRVDVEEDPQVQKAVALIPEARALYANARKILAEREASQTQTLHP